MPLVTSNTNTPSPLAAVEDRVLARLRELQTASFNGYLNIKFTAGRIVTIRVEENLNAANTR